MTRLGEIESIFPQNQLNVFIVDKLKEGDEEPFLWER